MLNNISNILEKKEDFLRKSTECKRITLEELDGIIELHKKYCKPGKNGKRADLRNLDLQHISFRNIDLSGADLRGACLHRSFFADVDLSESNFEKANLSEAVLYKAKAPNSNFSNANMYGMKMNFVNMEKSNFENSYMMRLSADGVFTGSIFKHADLALSSMNGSDLSCSDMTGCKLINASFNNVNLESAKLVKANIKGTKFRYTNFAGADLTGLDLNMAEIFYSNLYGAKTDNKYIQLCLTGICNRITYCIEDNRVWEGDWTGSLNDFEKKIKNRSISTDENLTYLKIIHCLKVMKGSGDLIDHVKRISECIRLL